MKLLIFTQKVDRNDTALSFFHRWIIEIAKQFEEVIVICLYKGSYELPANVRVFSLGKEEGKSRLTYLIRFYTLILKYIKSYDVVFAHQNQEYPILGGLIWRLCGKRVYMWRNHYAGSWITSLAAFFCNKVFCTSKYSYTARYKKIVFMPVGVDTEMFRADASVFRTAHSILSLGRISPSKKIDEFIKALTLLKKKGLDFTASIYGDALPKDIGYGESLKKLVSMSGLDDSISFHAGIPNTETPSVYSAHEIFVNLSQSGMYDKTIFEALACGCITIASSEDMKGQVSDDFIFKQGDVTDLALKLETVLKYSESKKAEEIGKLKAFTESHSLAKLAVRIREEVSTK